MGFVQVCGTCLVCGGTFWFNPLRVPSHKGEPICKPCITRVNERRQALGRPLWPVSPDAYEAIPEAELPDTDDLTTN